MGADQTACSPFLPYTFLIKLQKPKFSRRTLDQPHIRIEGLGVNGGFGLGFIGLKGGVEWSGE